MKFSKWLLAIPVLGLIIAFLMPSQTVVACGDSGGFFLTDFPTWHKYITTCSPDDVPELTGLNDIWLIAAAVLEMITRITALISIGMIIFGGFRFITSGGNPDAASQGRKTIIYALVGFFLAVSATALVSFLMNLVMEGQPTNRAIFLPDNSANGVQNIFRLIYGIAGAVSVLMIVIGGLKYVLSGGDPGKTNSARNTVIYAVVGLAVVIFSATILEFVGGFF